MKDAAPAEEQQKPAVEPIKPPAVLRSNVRLITNAVAEKETRTLFGRVLRQTAAVRRQLTAQELQAFLASALPPASAAAQQLQEAVKQVGHGAADLDMCPARVLGDPSIQQAHRACGCKPRRVRHHSPPTSQPPVPAPQHLPLILPARGLAPPVPQVADSAMDADGGAEANGTAAEEEAAPPPANALPEVEMYAHLLTLMFLLDHKQYELVGGQASRTPVMV